MFSKLPGLKQDFFGRNPFGGRNMSKIQTIRKGEQMTIFAYPATIQPNGEGGFIATFRDIPGALTEAEDLEELKRNALDTLVTAVEFNMGD